jgi:hypothetical protein
LKTSGTSCRSIWMKEWMKWQYVFSYCNFCPWFAGNNRTMPFEAVSWRLMTDPFHQQNAILGEKSIRKQCPSLHWKNSLFNVTRCGRATLILGMWPFIFSICRLIRIIFSGW